MAVYQHPELPVAESGEAVDLGLRGEAELVEISIAGGDWCEEGGTGADARIFHGARPIEM